MTITLPPALEEIVQAEIDSGRSQSVDEVVGKAISLLADQSSFPPEAGTLVDFFRRSPLVGLDLKFERDPDVGRETLL